ncbi:hypothetical protein EPI10_005610 [Gossypium australe]|uniref:Uncharacterized protein n=1 Tax=Gossypium australe TaxID=47621 RepID=A0A5B6WPW1_9ROSI|nr:hypothetical protein EPI10_005610 [Gossypium australe]
METYNDGFFNRITIISEQEKCFLDSMAYLYQSYQVRIIDLLRDFGDSCKNLLVRYLTFVQLFTHKQTGNSSVLFKFKNICFEPVQLVLNLVRNVIYHWLNLYIIIASNLASKWLHMKLYKVTMSNPYVLVRVKREESDWTKIDPRNREYS